MRNTIKPLEGLRNTAKKLLPKKRWAIVLLVAAVVVVIAAGVYVFFVVRGGSFAERGPLYYKTVKDICPYVDVTPLKPIAGDVYFSEPKDYGDNLVGCTMRLTALKQPDGKLMVGHYTVEATAGFTGETEEAIQLRRESWPIFWEGQDKNAAASSEVSTYAALDGVFDDAYSVTSNFAGADGGLLAYKEHVLNRNMQLKIGLSGTLAGKVTGDEFKSYVRKMIEGTFNKLEKTKE